MTDRESERPLSLRFPLGLPLIIYENLSTALLDPETRAALRCSGRSRLSIIGELICPWTLNAGLDSGHRDVGVDITTTSRRC